MNRNWLRVEIARALSFCVVLAEDDRLSGGAAKWETCDAYDFT